MPRGLAFLLAVGIAGASVAATHAHPPHRIVSLIPAVTEMLFATGAGPDVVGVSTFDRFPAEATTRPRVGALVDADVERILALRPTLVVTYETQTVLREQMRRASIATFTYQHGSVADIYDTIRRLGSAIGRTRGAEDVVRRMQTDIAAIAARTGPGRRVETLFVVGRDPGELRHVYVAGGQGFLNELVELAGGTNVFVDIARPAAEVSTEQLLSRRPAVIVELWPNRSMDEQTQARETAVWNALSILPAVRARRVVEITDERVAIPGPRLPDGIRVLALALHPEWADR